MEKAADYLAVYVKQNPKHVGPTQAPGKHLRRPRRRGARDRLAGTAAGSRRKTIRSFCRCWQRLHGGPAAQPGHSLARACGQGVRRHTGRSRRFRRKPDRERPIGARIHSAPAGVREGSRSGTLRRHPDDVVPEARPTEEGPRSYRLRSCGAIPRTSMRSICKESCGWRRETESGSRAAYEKALALNPRYQPALLNLARLDIADGKPDAARARLTEMLKINKNNGEAMFELALLEERAGRTGGGYRMAGESAADPETPGRCWRLPDGPAAAPARFRAGLEGRKRGCEPRAKELFGSACPRTGANCRGRQSRRQADAWNDGAVGRLRSGPERGNREAPVRSGRSRECGLQPRQDPEGQRRLSARTGVARRGRNRRWRLRQGRAACPSDRRALPAQGIGPRLSGDIAVARGQFPAAITYYRAALAKEKNADTALRVYRAQVLAGDTAKGADLPRTMVARQSGRSRRSLRVLADEQLRTGNLAAARSSYERLLQRNPDDVDALNNLAQVAIRQGDKAALDYAERAYKLAKTEIAIMDTLGGRWSGRDSWIVELDLLRDARLRDSSQPRNSLPPCRSAGPRPVARPKRGRS